MVANIVQGYRHVVVRQIFVPMGFFVVSASNVPAAELEFTSHCLT